MIYIKSILGISLCSILVLLSACSRDNHPTSPGVYINEKCVATIGSLEADDPILYVNGEKITKRDFEALLTLRDRLWRIHQKEQLICSESEFDEFRRKSGDGLMLELIHHAIFRQYAKEIGAEPSPENIKAAEKDLLLSIRRPDDKIEDIARIIGGDAGELFRKIPYIDARDKMLRQSITSNDLYRVSDAELKERIEFVRRFDENAENMNKKARARLLEAKKRIIAGSDMEDEAKKMFDAVHPEYAKEWGRFEIQEFPTGEDIHTWLLTAKEGDISDPLDTEDGIAIIKVIEKGKGEAPAGMVPPDAFTLVRCTVKACEKMRYQFPDQMRRQLLHWKNQDAHYKLGMMLSKKAVVEYPNGTNLFNYAEKKGN